MGMYTFILLGSPLQATRLLTTRCVDYVLVSLTFSPDRTYLLIEIGTLREDRLMESLAI